MEKGERMPPRNACRAKGGNKRSAVRPAPPCSSKSLREPAVEKFSKFGCRPELRNGIQVLERRGERVREASDGSRFELLILRFEVKIVHGTSQVFRGFEFALHEGLIDNQLGLDVR